jgi:hypothetical protein
MVTTTEVTPERCVSGLVVPTFRMPSFAKIEGFLAFAATVQWKRPIFTKWRVACVCVCVCVVVVVVVVVVFSCIWAVLRQSGQTQSNLMVVATSPGDSSNTVACCLQNML